MVETSRGGFWPSLYEPLARAGSRLAEWLSPASEASSNADAYHTHALGGLSDTVNAEVLTSTWRSTS